MEKRTGSSTAQRAEAALLFPVDNLSGKTADAESGIVNCLYYCIKSLSYKRGVDSAFFIY
jgi:hypothetical protein